MTQDTNSPDKKETENVVSDYLEGYQQLELHSAEINLRKARNAIFAIAAVFLISDLIIMEVSNTFTIEAFGVSLAICAVFVGLGFLTKKQPLTAILIALALFVAIWIFTIVVLGPQQIYKGIIFRIIIIYFLIKGIKHAREAERLRKEMNIH